MSNLVELIKRVCDIVVFFISAVVDCTICLYFLYWETFLEFFMWFLQNKLDSKNLFYKFAKYYYECITVPFNMETYFFSPNLWSMIIHCISIHFITGVTELVTNNFLMKQDRKSTTNMINLISISKTIYKLCIIVLLSTDMNFDVIDVYS